MAKHKRLKPIGDYLYDKGEMIEQMFSSIPIVEIRNMVPISLQGMPLHELKAECLVELLGISDREILKILDGKKERSVSSSDSEREGAFMISDDEKKIPERRIKKEKKDSVCKIKTERVSSKKDGTKKSPEPSTSKKKRKSKESVEVNSKKKKKSDCKPVDIPSSSRHASKVAVGTKKKKDKRDEKKKENPKKSEEDDIVVLDDDSDKEGKSEQKSLLDLLELEMRARAIRSLLKKEESVQAQKILSEYKDEPDDLIPVEIEPPQIELLSDSEGEGATNITDLGPNTNAACAETTNDGIPPEQIGDSLHSLEDQASRSLNTQNDDSSSVSRDLETIVFCPNSVKMIHENTPKVVPENESKSADNDCSRSSRTVMGDCQNDVSLMCGGSDPDDSIQSGVSNDLISTKANELTGFAGSALQLPSVPNQCTSCDPRSKPEVKDLEEDIDLDTTKMTSSVGLEKRELTSFSNEESKKELVTNHFLVIDGPSVVQVTDGSRVDSSVEINRAAVGSAIPPSDTDESTESDKLVDSLMGQVEFQQRAGVEVSQICSSSNVAVREEKPLEVSSPEDDVENRENHRPRADANSTLRVLAERRNATGVIFEEELSSQSEDEVLDYDYNPVNSFCEKVIVASFSQSEDTLSFTADCKTPSSENNCSDNILGFLTNTNEDKDDIIKVGCHRQPSDDCGERKPDSCREHIAEQSEKSGGNQVHPSDDSTFLSNYMTVEEVVPVYPSLTHHIAEGAQNDDSNNESSFKTDLETAKQKDDVTTSYFSSSGVLTDSEHTERVRLATIEDSIQERIGSERINDELTKKQDDHHNPPKVEETLSLDTCEDIRLNTEPCGLMDEDNYSKKKREVAGGKAECSGHHQVITEKAFHYPGLNSCSAQNEATRKEVFDNPGAVKGIISSTGKGPAVPSRPSSIITFDHASDSNHPIIQQTDAPQDVRNMLTRRSFKSDDDLGVVMSTVMCEHRTVSPDDSAISSADHSSSKTSEDRSSKCTAVGVDCTVESYDFSPSQTPSQDPQLRSVKDDVKESLLSGVCKSGEVQTSCSQDFNNVEIIDITGGENLENSEVLYVGEKRVDLDSLDGSDHEISDNAALVLEQMNAILNVNGGGLGDDSGSESCQPFPGARLTTSEIPAEEFSLNNGSTEPASDGEIKDVVSTEDKGGNTVLEVSYGEETSLSSDERSSDSNYETSSGNSNHAGTIEITDDSESVYSVESQCTGSSSDDCVVVLQPKGSISDDCTVTEPKGTRNIKFTEATEQKGSEGCAVVSQLDDSIWGEPVEVSKVISGAEVSAHSMPVGTPSTPVGKDNVIVTIIIEDGDGEEVQLLTEEVPAQILELKDDDEEKSNWTARWLESDNVKKVVKTSKILANVRKQMKMKLKKVEAPTINDPKPTAGKSAPSLIGSVEEYHRLVKEGVIYSKTILKRENPNVSRNLTEGSVNPAKGSSESLFLECTETEGRDEKVSRDKTNQKKSVKSEKLEKSGRRKKSSDYTKTKSDVCEKKDVDSSVLDSHDPEFPLRPCAKETKKSSNANQEFPSVAAGEDGYKEEGGIIDHSKSDVSGRGNQNDETKTNVNSACKVVDDEVCDKEQTGGKMFDGDDHEEGETSEKEEGEISDSDDDSKESKKSSQPNLIVTSGSNEICGGCVSSPSCIPLPSKPPAKKQLNKTPERKSAAKRLILRNQQLVKRRQNNSKNKKKRKKGVGGGSKKGLGYSSNTAPRKNKPVPFALTQGVYEQPPTQTDVFSSLAPTSDLLQSVTEIQTSHRTTYPGLAQPGSMTQIDQAQNANADGSNAAQVYDSYYSWAYSQGLINSANANYGYGTPESTPDSNVYKQWEEYYRKLMEACKVSAEHASAGSLSNTTEKSGYTWVFDHSSSAMKSAQTPTLADTSTQSAANFHSASIPSDISEVSQNVEPVTYEMSDKERFDAWQYRYGLKGLLKEHFVPAPDAPSTGSENQKS